jgi:hydroxymethylglutaryl-CoA synthase
MKTGILGYGVYVPQFRIKTEEIAQVWGKESHEIVSSLGVSEKSVADIDEDAVTLAYEAAFLALKDSGLQAGSIDACFVGSESHPYAVNPTSTIIGEFLGFKKEYLATDLQFACKAATTGMITLDGLISSGKIKVGMAIGADKAQAKPHDVLEYTASSAAAAFVLGNAKSSIAEIVDFTSFSSDTPDFWRRDGVRFPSHGGRFTGEPAYFEHVMGASKILLEKNKLMPSDFDYCVFHMPNGKFPRVVAKRLGFTSEQQKISLTFDSIGNPYTASSLIGLSAVLDVAAPGSLIFMASYGSGAGSDAFVIRTTSKISIFQKKHKPFSQLVSHKKYITYSEYLINTKKI